MAGPRPAAERRSRPREARRASGRSEAKSLDGRVSGGHILPPLCAHVLAMILAVVLALCLGFSVLCRLAVRG